MAHEFDDAGGEQRHHTEGNVSRRSVLRTAGLVAGTSIFGLPASAATSGKVLHNGFDTASLGTYTPVPSEWDGNDITGGGEQSHLSVVAPDGDRMLDAGFPAGVDGAGNGYGGGDFQVDLGQRYDELYCAYRVKFDAGFEFGQPGGKLPGLIGTNSGGGYAITGGDDPNGENGWSARMMWRDPEDPDDGGLVMFYTYHPDMPGTYGDNMYWDDGPGGQQYFKPGQWHTVEHRVVMNTPGKNDGVLEGWFDGEKAFERTDLRFRDVSGLGIDALYYSTFFGGGHDHHWAHTREEHIYFDDFVVSTDPISLDDGRSSGGGSTTEYPSWDASTVYTGGDRVRYDGEVWEAQWWSKGDEPSREPYTVWQSVERVDSGGSSGSAGDDGSSGGDNDGGDSGGSGDDDFSDVNGGSSTTEQPSWDASTVYTGGDRVRYDGEVWEAQWWSKGDEPSREPYTVWQSVERVDSGGSSGSAGDDGSSGGGTDGGSSGGSTCSASPYSNTTVYQPGDRVSYQGAVWEAELATMANPPSVGNTYWASVDSCDI